MILLKINRILCYIYPIHTPLSETRWIGARQSVADLGRCWWCVCNGGRGRIICKFVLFHFQLFFLLKDTAGLSVMFFFFFFFAQRPVDRAPFVT